MSPVAELVGTGEVRSIAGEVAPLVKDISAVVSGKNDRFFIPIGFVLLACASNVNTQ